MYNGYPQTSLSKGWLLAATVDQSGRRMVSAGDQTYSRWANAISRIHGPEAQTSFIDIPKANCLWKDTQAINLRAGSLYISTIDAWTRPNESNSGLNDTNISKKW